MGIILIMNSNFGKNLLLTEIKEQKLVYLTDLFNAWRKCMKMTDLPILSEHFSRSIIALIIRRSLCQLSVLHIGSMKNELLKLGVLLLFLALCLPAQYIYMIYVTR